MLGVPQEDAGRFRTWVHEMLEEAPTNDEVAERSFLEFFFYLQGQIEQRKAEPRDDLVTSLMNAELGGQPLTEKESFGGCLLLLIAGIDTTWSAIGEFLRAYAPVTMARMELRIAVQRLLERLPEFHLAGPDAVTWSVGQVRGLRRLPLRF